MLKALSFVGRVANRIARPLSRLRSTGKMIWGALGTVGLVGAANYWNTLRPWLLSDWTHAGVAALGILFIGSFLALYGMEKEADALRVVRVGIRKVKTDFRSVLHMSGAQGNYDEHDVFIYEIEFSFRNDSDKLFRAFFPQVELLKREGWRRWEFLNVRGIESQLVVPMHPRGTPNTRTQWYRERRYDIEARDEVIGSLHMLVTSPVGASAFLNRDLKIRLTIDFIGQPKEVLEIPLPRVTQAS